MEKSVVRKRLVEAAVLAETRCPPAAHGMFKIIVEAVGVHITYVFGVENTPGPYSLDSITPWGDIEDASKNPLIQAMTGLLAAAKDFKP